ncbi:MAG TPA: YraN family protein [Solimonas sp.]|nr:YraN family protein [Solimonas sp.]
MKGAAEEDIALRHLEQRGLVAVARNWRCRGGELDLVMRDGDTLVIAEVRMRGNPAFGSAAESVGARKQARLVHATRLFLAAHGQFAQSPVRFDVVALDGAGRLEWLRGAFEADQA